MLSGSIEFKEQRSIHPSSPAITKNPAMTILAAASKMPSSAQSIAGGDLKVAIFFAAVRARVDSVVPIRVRAMLPNGNVTQIYAVLVEHALILQIYPQGTGNVVAMIA